MTGAPACGGRENVPYERDEDPEGEETPRREQGPDRAAVERDPAQRLEQLDAAGGRTPQEADPGHDAEEAAKIMYEAHSTGRAVVKSCHKELAELYEERLLNAGLTASIEPA